jgi:amino acid transporter
MFNVLSRYMAVLGSIASAVALKWVFDRWLWDASFQRLALIFDFEKAEPIVAVLSYLVPLATAVVAYLILSPHPPKEGGPSLRKSPWQSPLIIVGVLVIIAATIGGLSLGRVFGLPSITLPQSR